jgi:general secretion pathway protein D
LIHQTKQQYLCFLTILIMCGCATGRMSFRKAEQFRSEEKYPEAIENYIKAATRSPNEARFRLMLIEATIEASNYYYRQALQHIKEKKNELARLELDKALEYNPANSLAKTEKKQLLKAMALDEKQAEKTRIEELKDKTSIEKTTPTDEKEEKLSLKFDKEIELDKIFKALGKTSDINIMFDPNFKNSKLAIALEEITFSQALDRICLMKELFYKVLDEKTILIIPDTESKHKVYDEQIIKNFYLSNLNAEECVKLITRVCKVKNISADATHNSLTVRETADKVALVEKLINFYDKRKAEVMMQVEILEVNKDRLREYGIELSQYQISMGLTTAEEAKTVKGNRFYYLDASDFNFTIPSVLFKLLENDGDSRMMARPHVRGLDGGKVEIKLGDKVPVPRTTFMPFATGGVEQQPITSFDLQDVGIEIGITPTIHHDAEITLELDFKLTFITSPGSTTIPPTIGNRSVKTTLRLKDGETGVMAGLLRDSERNSMKGFPLIAKIPILRDIFSSNMKQISQTDIILSITPHILRMPDITEEDLMPILSGTEDNVHLKKK